MEHLQCKICGADAAKLGSKTGVSKRGPFQLWHCPICHYSFVSNPWTDYQAIYTEAYYRGKGVDPMVDYVFELEEPLHSVRLYEWRGILARVGSLIDLKPETRWLDFGCGNGGLVRYCAQNGNLRVFGHEQGWIKEKAASYGIPFLDSAQLDAMDGMFDVVTAIEVLEHVTDPLDVLRRIRRLLRPDGLFFYTTGNAKPVRKKLLSWSYFVPEIHISLYEPETMVRALELSGFRPEFAGFGPGHAEIIKFKVLKNLGIRRISSIQGLIPWAPLSRLVDLKYGVTAHPIAWATGP